MADAASAALLAATPFLPPWFARYGGSATHEIEARVSGGVSAAVFNRVLRRLERAAPGTWSSTRVEETVDVVHASRTRATVREGTDVPPTFLVKESIERRDVDVPVGAGDGVITVRFSCSSEDAAPEPRPHDAAVRFRRKVRHTFCRKGEINYDLTIVRSGATAALSVDAPPEYEIELEWCAQAATSAGAFVAGGGAGLCAEKFRHKVLDVVALVASAQAAEAEAGVR